jgi:hypothetical protein
MLLMHLMPLHSVISICNLRNLRSVHQAEMLEDATWAGGIFRIMSPLLVNSCQFYQSSHHWHDAECIIVSMSLQSSLKRHNESKISNRTDLLFLTNVLRDVASNALRHCHDEYGTVEAWHVLSDVATVGTEALSSSQLWVALGSLTFFNSWAPGRCPEGKGLSPGNDEVKVCLTGNALHMTSVTYHHGTCVPSVKHVQHLKAIERKNPTPCNTMQHHATPCNTTRGSCRMLRTLRFWAW